MTSNVPGERLVELRAEERARVVAARPEGTTRAYGDADCTKGCTREWAEWCAAAPGSSLHGVAMDLEKPIYDVLVTPDKVEEFLGKYYTVRPRLNAQRETQGDGTSLGTKMINKVINALNDLYRAQRADQKLRPSRAAARASASRTVTRAARTSCSTASTASRLAAASSGVAPAPSTPFRSRS